MATKQQKGKPQVKNKARKNVKLSDLHVAKGGAVKGGTDTTQTTTSTYKIINAWPTKTTGQ